jgi:metallo-beta-lactamase class B
MKKSLHMLVAGTMLSSACVPVFAQETPARKPVSSYAKPVDYPKADTAAVAEHFNKARKLAGDDLYVFFNTLCIQDQLYKERINNVQYDGLIPPQKVFDNLYYIGEMSVSAWAINTPDGIIVIDALNSADEAREIMVPGLVKLELDPKNVKYVIITHSHGDHYGGAQFFRDTYGAKLVASATDWDVMAKMPATNRPKFDPPPKKSADDIAVTDGQTISLGGEVVHLAETPAHTPGTLSLWFKVTDNGASHVAGMYGGIGMPRTDDNKHLQLQSMAHWLEVTKAARVDAQIGNHPLHFDGPARLEELKYRASGEGNPFVIGTARYARFMNMMSECVRMSLAEDGLAN